MRYAMLLKPHANTRYRQSLQTLALTELDCCLRAWGLLGGAELCDIAGEPFVAFDAEDLTPEMWRSLSSHSGCCFAAQVRDGALIPVERTGRRYLPDELSQVLKYKGKTNADFTRMLLHCARDASAFAQVQEPLTVLDPLCGKATTLFCALDEGENAIGMDIDGKALNEADTYFERFLKLHRFKHRREVTSLTLPGGKGVKCVAFTVADTPERFKAGDHRILKLIYSDLSKLPKLLRQESCHLAVGDLPYGVQHAPQEGQRISSLEKLAAKTAEGCAAVLKKGGALALSFNAYTLRRDMVIQAMETAGLRVLNDPPYNGFAHWVEQAVDRDAVIGLKP